MTLLKRVGSACINFFVKVLFAIQSRGVNRELVERNARRGNSSFRWFTLEEAAVAEALGRIIVPSGEETPGWDEVGVLDAPAIVTLDRMIAASPERQLAYSRGLLSFDIWALEQHKCRFAEMSQEDQIALFRAAEQFNQQHPGKTSALRRVWRRFDAITQVSKGVFYAARLQGQIRIDCIQVFYTSRVSWTWLEYDGPPMEEGYRSLVEPRELGASPRASVRWNG
jgi:hypothetical protein